MLGGSESYFDRLVRDFARGQSRREFVGRAAAFGTVALLGHAGAPLSLTRPLASRLGLPDPCKTDSDCPACHICSPMGSVCITFCAGCQTCDAATKKCKDSCPTCEQCDRFAGPYGECGPDLKLQIECKSCDKATGEIKEVCTACEKCDRGYCQSNCPNRCETCDQGKCRKCEGPCEVCDEATGKCVGCDPRCEGCNSLTGICETTCPGGFSCCFGECSTCCRECGEREKSNCTRWDTCPSYEDEHIGTNIVCCGEGLRQCADLRTDLDHCGKCGNKCRRAFGGVGMGPTDENCVEGKCICSRRLDQIGGGVRAFSPAVECRQEGHECCDGECVEIAKYQSDPKHCGKCIVECEQDEQCVKGECLGSKRVGYCIRYHRRVETELRGLRSDYTYEAVVRQLAKPDSDGNNFVGRGTYTGTVILRKANCKNYAPEDVERITFEGRLKAGAKIPLDQPGGWMTFTLEPIDPPQGHFFTKTFRGLEPAMEKEGVYQPPLIGLAAGMIRLAGAGAHEDKNNTISSNECDGATTSSTETDVDRL